MGDVLSLIEKATAAMDEKKAMESFDRLRKNQFTLEDMMSQFTEVKKMGSLKDVLGMIPGMANKKIDANSLDDKAVDTQSGHHPIHDDQGTTQPQSAQCQPPEAHRRRIRYDCTGCHKLVKQFEETQKMMKQFNGMSKKGGKGFGLGQRGFPF